MNLAEKSCVPCRGGVPALTPEEYAPLLKELDDWTVADESRLLKSYRFKDFKAPMVLANKIADLSEDQGHHPDLTIRWGELAIELWTHKINGLTESDFVLAAKIDRLST
ncbi:MAG: 4a-hydroxytetrahydrobiopterin dehydratase [Candidatus Obscuribacterales bacterium]|nr:4a-hydroxytetrahydrobiopterin dehydratase [Candidatus Obscuribacterales bacterium]